MINSQEMIHEQDKHETRFRSAADCEDSHTGDDACESGLSFSMAALPYVITMINAWSINYVKKPGW